MKPAYMGILAWIYSCSVVLVGHLISPSIAAGLAMSGAFGFAIYLICNEYEAIKRIDFDDE